MPKAIVFDGVIQAVAETEFQARQDAVEAAKKLGITLNDQETCHEATDSALAIWRGMQVSLLYLAEDGVVRVRSAHEAVKALNRASARNRALALSKMSLQELEDVVESPIDRIESEREFVAVLHRLSSFARNYGDHALGLLLDVFADNPPECAAFWRRKLWMLGAQLGDRPFGIELARICVAASRVTNAWAEDATTRDGNPEDEQETHALNDLPPESTGEILLKTFRAGGKLVEVVLATYSNGRLAVLLFNADGDLMGMDKKEPVARLTINLVHAPDLPSGEVYVKTWDDNEHVARAALASGLFEDTGKRERAGFVQAQVWRIVQAPNGAPVGGTSTGGAS